LLLQAGRLTLRARAAAAIRSGDVRRIIRWLVRL
jgi:hypothetical protein